MELAGLAGWLLPPKRRVLHSANQGCAPPPLPPLTCLCPTGAPPTHVLVPHERVADGLAPEQRHLVAALADGGRRGAAPQLCQALLPDHRHRRVHRALQAGREESTAGRQHQAPWHTGAGAKGTGNGTENLG